MRNLCWYLVLIGVGTKINICRIADDYTTIGQDLVCYVRQ